MIFVYIILLFTSLFSQEIFCPTDIIVDSRSIYNIGDTLSIEDQNLLFPVCNGSGNYSMDDSFSFANQNDKITLISMNATW